jgi:hypothetical protein
LTAVDVPQSDVCGAGSLLDGSSLLTLTDGSLPAGGSCMFAVTLQVPIDSPSGTIDNVTSPLAAMVAGNAVVGDSTGVAQATAMVMATAQAIPTLRAPGLLLLALLLLGAGWHRLRRRR